MVLVENSLSEIIRKAILYSDGNYGQLMTKSAGIKHSVTVIMDKKLYLIGQHRANKGRKESV